MTIPPLPLANLWTAFVDSNGIGKTIVLVQVAMSVLIWSFMGARRADLKRIMHASDEFRRFFSEADAILGYYFQKPLSHNPLIVVYMAASRRLVRELERVGGIVAGVGDTTGRTLSTASMALVKGVAEETLSTESLKLENGMGYLAAGTTIAPFLGLLGTVWGVLDAFQVMGAKGAVNLSEVAPSLSTAMLTTVVGLVVAIPSVVGYNLLVNRIRRITISLDGFTDEYLARALAEFGGDKR